MSGHNFKTNMMNFIQHIICEFSFLNPIKIKPLKKILWNRAEFLKQSLLNRAICRAKHNITEEQDKANLGEKL